ncbi:MAG: arginine--tRNA ligase, partial [Rhodobacteraceae bacterium]|nr:arginine--tRNA ligase [Paracoccaceae bacterium]
LAETLAKLTVERPRDRAHGEISTNAAILCARAAKMAPRDLASALVDRLQGNEIIARADVAGPGFVNLVLTPEVWNGVITTALEERRNFGRHFFGDGRHVLIEFVSANPTGPLHVGHARGAAFGDALARLLEFTGYRVTREYYVNDAGAQIDTLARSAYLRYLEAHGRHVEFGEDSYCGGYLKSVGADLREVYGDRFVDAPEAEWMDAVRQDTVHAMMAVIGRDLASLSIEMDNFVHESSLVAGTRIDDAIEALRNRGLIYRGQLAPPKGKRSKQWESREQWLFRSTSYGDDIDRPIMKTDGEWTYFAPDIAYHHDKVERGFDELINIFGSDHGGYVSRLQAAVSALSDRRVPLDVKLVQQVNVIDRGEVLRMSKRKGDFVLLSEAINAVGADVTRFVMLMRRNEAVLDFDFEKVRQQSRDNAVFYVQYAHARVCSLIRRAAEAGLEVDDDTLILAARPILDNPTHLALMQKIAEWPRIVEMASRHHEPHRIVFFLTDLAAGFHAMWTMGGDRPELRFLLPGDDDGTLARLALARALAIAIAAGLDILGVRPATAM